MATVMNNDGYRLVFILLAVSGFSQVGKNIFYIRVYQLRLSGCPHFDQNLKTDCHETNFS